MPLSNRRTNTLRGMADELEQSSRTDPRSGVSARPTYEFIVDDSETLAGDSGPETPRKMSQSRRLGRPFTVASRPRDFRIAAAVLAVACVGVLVYLSTVLNPVDYSRDASAAAHTGATYQSGFDMKQNWGSYSPYFDTGSPFEGISKSALDGEYTLPLGCRLKQVHVLHRHGDRYPAGSTIDRMTTVANKLAAMTEPPHDDFLKWIESWDYTLSKDTLVGGGIAAMFESGARFWGTHGRLLYNVANQTAWSDNLIRNNTKPLLRAGDQQRIQDSARAWAAGFFGTYAYPSSGGRPEDHYRLLLLPESVRFNNSLAGYMACPNADVKGANTGSARRNIWVDIYLKDAVQRLQKALPGYENITAPEVLGLQDLCVFETAAYGSSAFCQLFTETEWRGFEYHTDLKFYGDSAHGSHVGPATGMSWIAELRARLRHQLITQPNYGVNTTLDSNPVTFPLNQPFYVDFTHDSVIASVLSAFQFSWTRTDLSPVKIQRPRQFIVSRLTPFSARLYVEVLESDDGHEYVRLKLNDRVLPLDDLHKCPDDERGLCPLKQFVESLDHALAQIDYDDVCFVEHDYKKYEP